MPIVSTAKRLTDDHDLFERYKKSSESQIYAVRGAGTTAPTLATHGPLEVELTIGNRWASDLSGDEPRFFAVQNGEVRIAPRSSVIVETLETLHLPNNLYGIIFPKGSLFQHQGLYPLTAKIDPTWHGPLRILLQNTSDSTRIVREGQAIAAVSFITTESTLVNSLGSAHQEITIVKRPVKSRLGRLFSDVRFSTPFAAVIGGLMAAAATLLVAGR